MPSFLWAFLPLILTLVIGLLLCQQIGLIKLPKPSQKEWRFIILGALANSLIFFAIWPWLLGVWVKRWLDEAFQD